MPAAMKIASATQRSHDAALQRMSCQYMQADHQPAPRRCARRSGDSAARAAAPATGRRCDGFHESTAYPSDGVQRTDRPADMALDTRCCEICAMIGGGIAVGLRHVVRVIGAPALVEEIVDLARGLGVDAGHLGEIGGGGALDRLERAEMLQQRALARRADAGDFLQAGLADVALAPRAVRADREAMRLVAQPLDEIEHRIARRAA